MDNAGNIALTGYYSAAADFGGGALTSFGSKDIFVAKYTSSGQHIWSHGFGNAGISEGTSVAIDASGAVIVVGYFTGTIDFGGGNLVATNISSFIAKYDAAGVYQWGRRLGIATSQYFPHVAVDASGNAIVIGAFEGTVDFGGGNLASAGDADIFLAKYSPAGAHIWSKRFGAAFYDQGLSVAVDAAGNAVTTGLFAGTVNFGGGGLSSAGNTDIFLAKFDPAGVHQWSKRFGSPGAEEARAVAVGGSGEVAITGYFVNPVDFGGGNLVSAGFEDVFLAKFDASGNHLWSLRAGSGGPGQQEFGRGVAMDASGNVFVTGLFPVTIDFGGGPLASAGGNDIFLAKFNSAGAHVWSRRFGSTANDVGFAVATDASGRVAVTGDFRGTVNFGRGNLSSAGDDDVFLATEITIPGPGITSIVDIGNDQGRKVKIRFNSSCFDMPASPTPVVQYEAYRRDDLPPSQSSAVTRVSSGRRILDDGWTQVGVVAAHAKGTYGIDVPTIGDSTITLGQYYSHFFVRAATQNPLVYYDSPPDSGYSLDNLAPAIPSNLIYSAGSLVWDESKAADFRYYSVYGANTNSVYGALANGASVGTLIGHTVAPTMNVSSSPYVYYFVTVTDFSGNEGKPAAVNTLSGVGDTPKRHVLSISAYPNPFNPETTVRYTLPSNGRVRLDVFDAHGAHVRSLRDRVMNEGAYTVVWDGRDADGKRVGSGIYFARLQSVSGERNYKLVLLK